MPRRVCLAPSWYSEAQALPRGRRLSQRNIPASQSVPFLFAHHSTHTANIYHRARKVPTCGPRNTLLAHRCTELAISILSFSSPVPSNSLSLIPQLKKCSPGELPGCHGNLDVYRAPTVCTKGDRNAPGETWEACSIGSSGAIKQSTKSVPQKHSQMCNPLPFICF